MMPNVSVTLLNCFAAAADGVAVPENAWRLKKARELVKLLALARPTSGPLPDSAPPGFTRPPLTVSPRGDSPPFRGGRV